ncbi:hypothetical protein ACQP2F_11370 [Actinoplanes sp. CA-030573]|uniref:hypothetical protein n=1 Tax=Actinoplanes sp. CA-030573 TaxID=3239898 RepID=UPI003D8A1851
MRTWRADRDGLEEADRLVAGDRAGPGSPGLDHLLDAVRAPGTPGEMSGERAMVAALAAERRRAALTTRPKGSIRVQVPASGRRFVVSLAAGVAVLGLAGTAVAAETGSLPAGVQQHAHRLFSALGVPAPRTGTTPPAPARSRSRPAHTPRSTPAPTTAGPATTTPGAGPAVAWCAAWRTAADGGKPMNGRDRKDLVAAAGGADNVASYCARIAPSTGPAGPATSVTTTKPGRSPSHKPKPSHPTPHATTPGHPGNGK